MNFGQRRGRHPITIHYECVGSLITIRKNEGTIAAKSCCRINDLAVTRGGQMAERGRSGLSNEPREPYEGW